MKQKPRIILGILAAVLAIALFGGGIYAIEKWSDRGERSSGEEADNETLLYLGDEIYELNNNIESYLIIGTDNSGNEKAEGTDEYRGSMADFLLLLVINKTDETYGFLQIDRNTITDIMCIDTEGNSLGEVKEQLCCAHWYGGDPEQGCNNTVYTVSELVGSLPIDGYFSMHMSDIGILNHAVGGVEVTLQDDFSAQFPEMTKGKTLTLTDEEAEAYVRSRMDIGGGTNVERMDRQTTYMQAFKAKAIKLAKDDPDFVEDLYDKLLASSGVTDIPGSQLSVIMNQIYKGEDLGILRLEGETKEGRILDDGLLHEEFYPTDESITEAMKTLCGLTDDDLTE